MIYIFASPQLDIPLDEAALQYVSVVFFVAASLRGEKFQNHIVHICSNVCRRCHRRSFKLTPWHCVQHKMSLLFSYFLCVCVRLCHCCLPLSLSFARIYALRLQDMKEEIPKWIVTTCDI